MKKIIIPILLSCSTLSLAQTETKGQIKYPDVSTSSYFDLIFKSDQKIEDEISTDENGNFTIILEEGNYQLIIEEQGIVLHTQNVTIKNGQDIGVIIVPKNEQVTLTETVVKGQKKLVEKKVDRLIFNPDQAEGAKGGNAIDALRLAPRIKVDDTTDAISIIGKGSVMVLINDRLSQMSAEQLTNYLKTIRAEDIEKIEIITNPPAKYDASGNAGVLNIVLKTGKANSINGNVSLSGNYIEYGNYDVNAGINFRKDKWTVSGRAFTGDGEWGNNSQQTIDYPTVFWEANNRHRNENGYRGLGALIDYQLTSKTTTGINLDYTTGDGSVNSQVKTDIYDKPDFNLNRYLLTDTNGTGWDWEYIGFNYHIIHKFDEKGKKLTFDFDYSKNNSTDINEMISDEFDANSIPLPDRYEGNITTNDFKADHYNFSLDMEHPLEKWSMNYGMRIRLGNDESQNNRYYKTTGDYEEDVDYRFDFAFKENIYALYYSLERKFGEKWSAKVGVRYEHADSKGKSRNNEAQFNRQFDDFFPTAYIMYQPKEDHSFSLNYSRRIDRPSMWNLNPMLIKSNEYNYTVGNPDLLPSYSTNFELEYAYKDLSVTSLFFNSTDDIERRITEVDPETQIRVTKAYNFAKTTSIGISENINVKLAKWWKLNTAINAYYIKTEGKIPSMNYDVEGMNADIRFNNNFELNQKKTLFANYSYSYRAAGQDSDMDKYNDYLSHNAGIRALLFEKKLQVSFNVNNIFENHQPTYRNIVNGVETRNSYEAIRNLRLSITYNFGKQFDIERSKSNQVQSGGGKG